jgi:hypothetical protein
MAGTKRAKGGKVSVENYLQIFKATALNTIRPQSALSGDFRPTDRSRIN